jgi:hypothetical protein
MSSEARIKFVQIAVSVLECFHIGQVVYMFGLARIITLISTRPRQIKFILMPYTKVYYEHVQCLTEQTYYPSLVFPVSKAMGQSKVNP